LRGTSLSILDVSIPTVISWYIILFNYLGFPILWFSLDPFRSQVLNDQAVILELFLFTSASITFLYIGFFIARYMMGPLKLREFFLNRRGKKNNYWSLFIMLFCLFLSCCLFLYRYMSQIGLDNIPLLVALDFFPSRDLTRLRSDATNNFENQHWNRLFAKELLIFTTFSIYSLYLFKKTKIKMVLLFISLSVSAFSLTMLGEKAQIMELLIGFLLVYVIINSRSSINLKMLVIFSSISLGIVVPIYYMMMGSSNFLEALMHVSSRVTTGQIHPGYVYLTYIPEHRDFLFGTTFPNPGSIFPFESVTITQEIMAWDNPGEAKLGIVGSMPAMFWVEAFINFGLFSVPIISLLIGFFLFGVNKLILKLRIDPLVVGLYVWIIIFYKNLAISFFSDFFLSIYLMVVIITFSVMYLFLNKGKIFLSNKNNIL